MRIAIICSMVIACTSAWAQQCTLSSTTSKVTFKMEEDEHPRKSFYIWVRLQNDSAKALTNIANEIWVADSRISGKVKDLQIRPDVPADYKVEAGPIPALENGVCTAQFTLQPTWKLRIQSEVKFKMHFSSPPVLADDILFQSEEKPGSEAVTGKIFMNEPTALKKKQWFQFEYKLSDVFNRSKNFSFNTDIHEIAIAILKSKGVDNPSDEDIRTHEAYVRNFGPKKFTFALTK